MKLMDAIYSRRSIRNYKKDTVSKDNVEKLIEAAIQAPSAMNSQPWAFAVIQDTAVLKNLSDRAKALLLNIMKDNPKIEGYGGTLSNPDFNIFYNASTLIIIYANAEGIYAQGDCCLAAQNLMLAAHGYGLGTCWIGFSLPLLNQPEVKQELGVDPSFTPVASLVVGYPEALPKPTPRKEPNIIVWK